MRIIASLFTVMTAILLATTPAAAETCHDPTVRFDSGAVVLPFELSEGMVMVRARLANSSQALWMVLDTGSTKSYLDREVARRLGLRGVAGGTVRGAGRDPTKVEHVEHVAFVVPHLESSEHDINLVALKQSPNDRVDGIWGADFIGRFVVTIDYAGLRLTLASPCGYEYKGQGAVLPIAFNSKRIPFIRGTISVESKRETSQLFVDSGSGDAVDHPLIRTSKGPLRHIQMGVGLGDGRSEAVIGHADWLELGGFSMTGALTACCGPNEDTHHLIGGGILRRFTVILDYARSRLMLEPNAHFHEPFPDR
jgi:hypothetical protein